MRCNALTGAIAAIVLFATAGAAFAQGMYLKEIPKDGKIYVFNIQANADRFEKTGETGAGVTMLNAGPNRETVIGDTAKALQLYFFKHNIPMVVPDAPAPAPTAPPWKISGLLFGDYYNFTSDHLPAFQKQHGVWIRRAYFTYDHTFSPTVTTRFRVEANGNGKLAGGVASLFLKDAYVRWTFHGRQQLIVGLQPSLTWEFIEGVWGLRHIEKPSVDIYKVDVSREMGFTLAGPLNKTQTLKYQLQFGNDSGFNGETDRFKGYRAAARYEKNPGISIEGVVAFLNRALNADRTTAQVFAAYRAKRGRAGLQYTFQRRRAADGSGLGDVDMTIVSAFGVYDLKPQKYSVFVRVDRVADPCADCGGIDYLPIDTKEAFTLTIAGLEYYIHPAVRFSPNVELVNYGNPPTGPKPKKDVVARLTFYWAW